MPKITRTKQEWKLLLPPENFHVLIEKGTEPPFTGKFYKNKIEEPELLIEECERLLSRADIEPEMKKKTTAPGRRGRDIISIHWPLILNNTRFDLHPKQESQYLYSFDHKIIQGND